MGPCNYFLLRLWNFLSTFVISPVTDYGTVIISNSGNMDPQQIFVPTELPVNKVWVSFTTQGAPVCGGGTSFLGEPIPVDGGFVFTIIVESNICEVDWFAQIG